MNYEKNYFQLIEKAKSRKTDLPTEIHHILPRSLGGTDEETNLVKLTFREHYLAHYLLWKFTTGEEHKKMARALFVMSQNGKILSPECYERLRAEICKKVICIQTLQIFSSVNEAIYWLKNKTNKQLPTIKKNINLVLRGKRKSIYNFSFEYYDEGKEYKQIDKIYNAQFFNGAKKVICLQTLQVFDNAREAEKVFKISFKNISTSCRLERSTKGYDFRFYEEGKEYEKIDMKPIHIQQNKKIICNETGEIFDSQKQLAEKLNTGRSNIKRYIISGKPFRGLTYSFFKS